MNRVQIVGEIDSEIGFKLSQTEQYKLDTFCRFNPNMNVLIEISKYSERLIKQQKRTEQQNKYYHKLLDIICDFTGDIHAELHNNLKCMFLAKPWIREDREYLIVGSTRDLKPKEFGDYLEKVFNWASSELGLILPSSDEYY